MQVSKIVSSNYYGRTTDLSDSEGGSPRLYLLYEYRKACYTVHSGTGDDTRAGW